ncbi:MAG: DUF1488 family protein [Candidatus Thiodiazotropha sp. DIVDIV]
MSVKFPNPSHSFEVDGNQVCFWGYDNVIEIVFYVEEDATKKLCSGLSDTEAGFLKAFDSVRKKSTTLPIKSIREAISALSHTFCLLRTFNLDTAVEYEFSSPK